MRTLAPGTTLDGEIVCVRDAKRAVGGWRPGQVQQVTIFLVSDLMALGEEDWRERPIEERRERLARLVAGIDGIVLSELIEGDGAVLYEQARLLGLEGIVSKRRGSSYVSGLSSSWVRCRCVSKDRKARHLLANDLPSPGRFADILGNSMPRVHEMPTVAIGKRTDR